MFCVSWEHVFVKYKHNNCEFCFSY
uniref:Uncharacterized protein n=1 Tax=Anguilla anguilla TaxID=7936 RepID=A0A0E9XR61_ANGAN